MQIWVKLWSLALKMNDLAGTVMVGEQDLAVYLSKFDKKYWLTYKVLDILQKVAFPSLTLRQEQRIVQQCTSRDCQTCIVAGKKPTLLQ